MPQTGRGLETHTSWLRPSIDHTAMPSIRPRGSVEEVYYDEVASAHPVSYKGKRAWASYIALVAILFLAQGCNDCAEYNKACKCACPDGFYEERQCKCCKSRDATNDQVCTEDRKQENSHRRRTTYVNADGTDAGHARTTAPAVLVLILVAAVGSIREPRAGETESRVVSIDKAETG